MIKTTTSILISLFAILLVSSCYYDNNEVLYPNLAPCDTVAVTFSRNIQPIFNSYCTSCHGSSAGSLGGGIDLRTYVGVNAKITRIYGAMNQSSGYSPMPKGSNKLDDCKLNQVKKWIALGAQNN